MKFTKTFIVILVCVTLSNVFTKKAKEEKKVPEAPSQRKVIYNNNFSYFK